MRSADSPVLMAFLAALLFAGVSAPGPSRGNLIVGAQVVSPCSVRSGSHGTSHDDRPVAISCAEMRKAEIRSYPAKTPATEPPSSAAPLVTEKSTSDWQVVEVTF